MASTTPHNLHLLLFLLPFIIASVPIKAQSSSRESIGKEMSYLQGPRSRPTLAVIIAAGISALILLSLYAYSRNCLNEVPSLFETAVTSSLSGRHKSGLDPAILDSFPTMLYSEVKEHRLGTSSLECAVCLNEFEDDDSLRLLPKCNHVFHEECIDAWLVSHVTCPVCRSVLEVEESREAVEAAEEQVEVVPAVVVVVEDEEERMKEREELARIASRSRRGAVRKQMRLVRSHTTGHIGEDFERYTLRLPESVRNEIMVARRLRRERSLPASGVKGEVDGEKGGSGRRSLKRLFF